MSQPQHSIAFQKKRSLSHSMNSSRIELSSSLLIGSRPYARQMISLYSSEEKWSREEHIQNSSRSEGSIIGCLSYRVDSKKLKNKNHRMN